MKTTTAENIRKELKALADPKYRKFHSYLLPGTDRQYSWCAYTSTADNGKRYNQER